MPNDHRQLNSADNVTPQKIIIVTGLSGSGKSTALAALEDAGFYCVDNMPVLLLPKFLELSVVSTPEMVGFAFGMDLREKNFLVHYRSVFDEVGRKGFDAGIMFLEADEEILLQRFSQTRRHHPVSQGKSLLEGIRSEQDLMTDLRKAADRVIDTSHCNVHELKAIINNIVKEISRPPLMRIQILSFGFKYGIPRDADLVADVRFLNNPYFVPELKNLDGEVEEVKRFVLQNVQARLFLTKYFDLLDYLIPLYEKEGKAYLTIAVGCTGGRHRSVAITRAIYDHIRNTEKDVSISHRDIART